MVVKLTVPVGVTGLPAVEVSVTVALHVVVSVTLIVLGAQTTVVLVVRKVTVKVKLPLLALWVVSAP